MFSPLSLSFQKHPNNHAAQVRKEANGAGYCRNKKTEAIFTPKRYSIKKQNLAPPPAINFETENDESRFPSESCQGRTCI